MDNNKIWKGTYFPKSSALITKLFENSIGIPEQHSKPLRPMKLKPSEKRKNKTI